MPTVNLTINVKGDAEGKAKNLTSSFLKAELALVAIKAATKAVIDIGKKAVEEFIKQEQAEAQLEATLKSTKGVVGLTSKELKNLANGFQNTTNFADDTILRAESLLLTFTKIGKDVFPAATETILNMSQALGQDVKQSAIQVGKALQDPIQGVTALRRVGIQLSDAQTEQIKKFMEMNDIASAQKVILGELETQFGGSAAAARDTFGGALKSLENVQSDILETFGQFVAVIGRDIVEGMIDAGKAINDFIKSADTLEKISNIVGTLAGAFEVIKTIFSEVGKIVSDEILETVKIFSDRMSELSSTTQISINIFDILSGYLKGISIGYTTIAKIIRLAINAFFDWINVVKTGVEVVKTGIDGNIENFKAFRDAIVESAKIAITAAKVITKEATFEDLTNQIDNAGKSWDEYGKITEETAKKQEGANKKFGDAFSDLYGNIVSGVKDIVSETIEEFSNMNTVIEDNSKALEEKFTTAFENSKNKIKSINDEIESDNSETTSNIIDNTNEIGKSFENVADNIADALIKSGDSLRLFNEENKKTAQDTAKFWIDESSKIISSFQQVGNEIGNLMKQIAENRISIIESTMESEIAAIENGLEAELEARGLAEESEIDRLQRLLDEKQSVLDQTVNLTEQANLQEEISDIQRQLTRATLEDETNKKIQKSRKKAAQEKAQIEKQAFEAEKAMKIAQIWINAAVGVVSAWASFMSSPGGIPGAILAGITTAAILALAGVQTGIVASQTYTPPSFQTGVENFGVAKVHGGEMVTNLPAGSNVFTKSETSNFLKNLVETKQNILQPIYLTINNSILAKAMIEIKENEITGYAV